MTMCTVKEIQEAIRATTHLSGRLPVESRDSYHQIGDDEQQDDRQ